MICYHDRTFCISPNCTCGRKLTDHIREAAKKAGLPVAMAYFCGESTYNTRPEEPSK